jgi:catechol 2,3-dioxygenase-like lactoylglutathione lyase family enzyme
MVGAIESVTVGVPDLEAAVTDYRRRLQWTVLRNTCASVGLLAAWHRPVHESVRLVELGMPDRACARLRLAQFEYEVRTAHDAQADPGPPIAVITEDATASARFYTEGFGWRLIEPPTDEARARFPAGSSGFMAFAAKEHADPDVVIAHRASPGAPRPREASMPGRLGVALATCPCQDLDAVEQRLAAIGIEPVTRPTHVGLPAGRPGRVMLVRGPADELFELFDLTV